LSAHTDAVDAAAKMSAVGYLSKPVALEQLLGMVERFCAVDSE
jgi:DNA-binding NtrC family response regulator